MQLSRITLVAPGRTASDVTAALIVDLIRAAAGPDDRVEHVVARAAPGLVEVGIFAQADSPQTARRRACQLVRRVLEMSLQLAGWRVDCWDGSPPSGPEGRP